MATDIPYGQDYPEPEDDWGIKTERTDPKTNGHRPFSTVTLSDVVPERVSWLWPGRIPMGKVITLDGDPGVGKSTLALTCGAVVTTGGMWPDKTHCDYPGDVILLSAEDGLADTIRPRLDAAGADTTRVHAVQGVSLSDEPEDGLRDADAVRRCPTARPDR